MCAYAIQRTRITRCGVGQACKKKASEKERERERKKNCQNKFKTFKDKIKIITKKLTFILSSNKLMLLPSFRHVMFICI